MSDNLNKLGYSAAHTVFIRLFVRLIVACVPLIGADMVEAACNSPGGHPFTISIESLKAYDSQNVETNNVAVGLSLTFKGEVKDNLTAYQDSATLTCTWSGAASGSSSIKTSGATSNVTTNATFSTSGTNSVTLTVTGPEDSSSTTNPCKATQTISVKVIKVKFVNDLTNTAWSSGGTYDATNNLTTDSYDTNKMAWSEVCNEGDASASIDKDTSTLTYGTHGGGKYTVTAKSTDLDSVSAFYTQKLIKVAFITNTVNTAWSSNGTYDATNNLAEYCYDTNGLKWEISPSDATIDISSGLVTFGTGGGSYTITATSTDLVSVTDYFTLKVIKVAFITNTVNTAWYTNGTYNAKDNLTTDSYDTANLDWEISPDDASIDDNGLVKFGPSGGSYTVTATSADLDSVYDEFTLNVVQMLSQTDATIPTDQTRTTVGVGELVHLWLVPSADATSWTTSAGGVSPTNGNATIFTATNSSGTATITATFDDGSHCAEDFSVIEPSGYAAPSITPITGYGQNVAGAGMTINLLITPTNVSFYKVQIMEIGRVSSNATGYFTNTTVWPADNLDHGKHGAGAWARVKEDNSVGPDTANSGVCPQPWSDGHFSWPIPAVWQVVDYHTSNSLPWSDQDFMIDTAGSVTIRKFGHTVTRATNDVYTTAQ